MGKFVTSRNVIFSFLACFACFPLVGCAATSSCSDPSVLADVKSYIKAKLDSTMMLFYAADKTLKVDFTFESPREYQSYDDTLRKRFCEVNLRLVVEGSKDSVDALAFLGGLFNGSLTKKQFTIQIANDGSRVLEVF